jgi:hypothetical protein
MPTSENLKINDARLSFAHLWVPKPFEEGAVPKYQATFLIDPSSKAGQRQIDKILAVAEEVMKAQWPDDIPVDMGFGFGYADGKYDLELCGKEFRTKPHNYDGWEGMFFLTAYEVTRPRVIDGRRNDLAQESGKPYSGCYVNGLVSLWTQNNRGGKRVNANLRAVQFVRDGEAFGAPPVNVEEEFDVIEDDDDPLA